MVFALIVLAAASRLLPHPPNFAPVAAIGLFAGAHTSRRAGWLVPFAALLASDALLGFYSPVGMLWNYLAFAACLLLGSGFLARRRSALRLGGAVLTSSVAFFAISNFGMWASGYYPRTLAGLVECYVAALPFFRNTLASDVLYSAVLFGGYALIARLMERRSEVTVRS
jgi:ABC-type transport system involved in cytochrome c biogenesis permease subunit